jgi:hypothetical protein
MPAMGSSPERKGERGHRYGGALGRLRAAGGEAPWGLSLLLGCLLRSIREEELIMRKKKRRRKERRKIKGRKRKEKRKNMEFFPNLKFFGEKNKRQLMKLVKIIFLKERYMPNYK